MKRHGITLEEVQKFIDQEQKIHIASSYRANYPISKKLEYLPLSSEFLLTVRRNVNDGITSNESRFIWTQDAVEAYNEVEV